MKLFRRAKPLLTWREPPFFAARTRDRRGWILRGLLALFIFSGMMLGFYANRNWGGRGPKFSVVGGVLLSACIGIFLTALLDAPDLGRDVTISDDSISSFGSAGTHVSMSTWALRDILWVRLVPPQEFGRSFGAMEFASRRGRDRIGVSARVSMKRIAEVLQAQGISVNLPGWQPTEAESGSVVESAAAPSAPAMMPSARARVEPLAEGEAGQILSPFRYRLALAMALGPTIIALLFGLGLCGYVLYRNQFLRAPASITDVGALLGGLGLLGFGSWFAIRFGNLAPSLYLQSVARSVIELRPGAAFDSRDPDVVYVEVIPRSYWGKAMTKSFSDAGLLKIDKLSRCVLFEGDQERWQLPAASLLSVEVESYRAASHVEGQEGGEIYFVVVIRANVGGAVWEAPVSKCHVEFRPKNNRLRESNALALRELIQEIRPSGLAAARPLEPGAHS